jgi:hypothetical protein
VELRVVPLPSVSLERDQVQIQMRMDVLFFNMAMWCAGVQIAMANLVCLHQVLLPLQRECL